MSSKMNTTAQETSYISSNAVGKNYAKSSYVNSVNTNIDFEKNIRRQKIREVIVRAKKDYGEAFDKLAQE